jgi:class 3 adenylate cyclase
MFLDICDSTARAAELGDRRWADLMTSFYAGVRRELDRHAGTELDTAGDGFFVLFDGPARAIRCATAIRSAVEPLGLRLRTGIHTGECERSGAKIAGLGVVIGARVCALAGPGEILVSRTVTDLVFGSDIGFEDAGEHELKGVPGRWQLYRLTV